MELVLPLLHYTVAPSLVPIGRSQTPPPTRQWVTSQPPARQWVTNRPPARMGVTTHPPTTRGRPLQQRVGWQGWDDFPYMEPSSKHRRASHALEPCSHSWSCTEKLQDMLQKLTLWLDKCNTTKWELLPLIGKLSFAIRVVPVSRIPGTPSTWVRLLSSCTTTFVSLSMCRVIGGTPFCHHGMAQPNFFTHTYCCRRHGAFYQCCWHRVWGIL